MCCPAVSANLRIASDKSPVTHLESTLIKVFILNNLKPFRMNTCEISPRSSHFAQFWCSVSPFRINTCKSVSKQRTLTTFRMNTYEKQGGRGVSLTSPDLSLQREHKGHSHPYCSVSLFLCS